MVAAAAAIDRPQVGGVVEVEGSIGVGRGTVTPAAGTAVKVLLAGGEPVGLLVDGPAAFRYVVEDRFSVPVARRNAKRVDGVSASEAGGKLVFEERLASAAIWSRRLAAEAGAGAGGEGAAGGLPQRTVEVLDNLLAVPPSHVLLEESGLGATGRAWALLHGERRDLVLRVDPLVDRRESLAALAELTRRATLFAGKRILHDLAHQPIGREWWERTAAPLQVVHEAIEVDNRQGREVTVTTRARVKAQRAGASTWRVSLATDFSDGERILPTRVLSVEVDGEPARYLHHVDELLVDLGRPLAAGQTAEVEVVNAGPYAIRPNEDSYWYLSTWSWYPQPAWSGELATLEMTVRTPEPFVPFASGETIERTSEDGFNVVRTRLDKPMQFPVVAAGKYHLYEEERDGRTITVATYAFGKEKAAKVLAELFFASAATYEQFFGVRYPFDELDVVEINQWGWGQAPPGVMFITAEAYNPINDTISRIYSQGINGRYAHEVAHAFWGHVIKMDSPEEQWLTESFADYSAALAMKAMMPGKRGEREFSDTLREWKSRTEQIGEGGSIYLANYLAGEDEADFRDRTWLLYNKGPLVLHALRQELGRRAGSAEQGDRQFQALLRAMQTNFSFQYGETRHLVGILEQMTGSDWQPWFERYVYGTEVPPVDM
ncbi:MAG TPA: M1 family aminopeptidase [Thermoanaerobaculia bacterium]|nr:M1 family aminopeptidase [Thermoanaerobaculia bacterium]